MKSLVLSLQADSLDESVPTTQLLKKARALSVKLGADQLNEWIARESGGYPPDEDVPEYRDIVGKPRVFNPYHGWQPLHIADSFTAHLLSTQKVKQSVAELESFKLDGGSLHMQYSNKIKMTLMKEMTVPLEPVLSVQPASIVGVLDAVRNVILDWTLELEKQGVLGKGLVFSAEDKTNATTATYNITNNIGSMHGSQLQQVSESSNQKMIVNGSLDALVDVLDKIGHGMRELQLQTTENRKLEAEIATVRAQANSPEPRFGLIRECVESIKTILEAAAGNVAATAYLSELGVFV